MNVAEKEKIESEAVKLWRDRRDEERNLKEKIIKEKDLELTKLNRRHKDVVNSNVKL